MYFFKFYTKIPNLNAMSNYNKNYKAGNNYPPINLMKFNETE